MTGQHAPRLTRRSLLAAAVATPGIDWADALPRGVTPTPPAERRVAIAYSVWHEDQDWKKVWGAPARGFYRSDDPTIIRAHAEEVSGAGIDFFMLDATNDIGSDIRTGAGLPYQRFEEHSIATVFDVYAGLPRRPRLCFMVGYVPHSDDLANGRVTAKASEIYDVYVSNPRYAPLLEMYNGRPLLIVYGETPARWQNGLPPWSDPRFTVRFMTAGLTQQPALLDGRVSRFGYWSWQDRGPAAYPVFDGHPEAMMITAFWPEDREHHRPGQGRDDGRTFLEAWRRARRIGPRFLMLGTYNEYNAMEQPSAALSKDIEPNTTFGTQYLDMVRAQAALFHAGR